MVKLRALLAQIPAELGSATSNYPALEQEITGLTTNSWTCKPGDLFIGMPGTRVDGGDFWASAIEAGAVAALVSTTVKGPEDESACVIPMTDMSRVCAEVATAFYDHPSQKMQMVGVTGTNGK
ncbi:MAG: Mur ligase domain-containing protein, partial [Thermosynechococcaceae cyanobacterium]